MTDTPDSDPEAEQTTREQVIEDLERDMEWPMYCVVGGDVDAENFVEEYYRIDGPDGPAYRLPPDGDRPIPVAMSQFALDVGAHSVEIVEREDTPWAEYEDA